MFKWIAAALAGVIAGGIGAFIYEIHGTDPQVHTDPDLVVDPAGISLQPLDLHARQTVPGLLQFRGNPTRSYYGTGPIPHEPRILWRYPDMPLCAKSRVGAELSTWCGTGWTGQPAIWERPDGLTEIVVGTYDRCVHFLNAENGRRTRRPFCTGDIIKGSVTLDPDGDPLLYFGSRDNKLRIVALDRPSPVELWSMDADFVPGIWNNDWDGNPTVIDDILLDGGENGYFFALKLNRDYDPNGRVQVSPELLLAFRSWNDALLAELGDENVSIENSVAVYDRRVYFANSGGRVLGLDLHQIHAGRAPVVFDFWAGDDIDASIVVDHDGMLYVAVELERYLPRSDELGQLLKLDPYRPADPVLWSLSVPPSFADFKGGIWSTPALGEGVLYVTTHAGQLLTVDSDTGQVYSTHAVGPHAWSSPVVVEDKLLVATCRGELRCYSILDPLSPRLEWTMRIPTGACIESTPAVWKGRIVIGARDGYIYCFGQPEDWTAALVR
ncbi:MAG: PQQ-binding-like beta-propeller repeat protein [Deltaproteobacteria bacterium]|nr:PQQ-binding-like beta-propeller repeat protein [Deltaproteobacteria bacterium]